MLPATGLVTPAPHAVADCFRAPSLQEHFSSTQSPVSPAAFALQPSLTCATCLPPKHAHCDTSILCAWVLADWHTLLQPGRLPSVHTA